MNAEKTTVDFEQLEHDWAQALVNGDVARLEKFLHPDYELVVSGAPDAPVSREAWLKLAASGYVMQEFQITSLRTRHLGDTATVSCLFRQRATVNGFDRSGSFFIVDIWTRYVNDWRVLIRYSSQPEPRSDSVNAVVGSDSNG
jgi:ketosteroid isomerase-like protein